MSKKIVYNLLFKNEHNQWFRFRDANGRFATRISDKPMDEAIKDIWHSFRLERGIHSDYHKLGSTVKIEPNKTMTNRIELKQRAERLKKEKQINAITQNLWICPNCGRHIGPDKYCAYCENEKEGKYEQ